MKPIDKAGKITDNIHLKILMTVHHGSVFTEIARGSSFEECVAYLSHTPLFVGYGPTLDKMEALKESGKMSLGWANYEFYNDEQIGEMTA